ncbi:hypothetical protein [Pontibacter sp. H249]|uniref:hypothetical protein n=1 Tax=Pontibacter sp. H249 TaxID=3133420 RepID=UPI0030C5F105
MWKIILLTVLTFLVSAAHGQHKLSGKYSAMLSHSGATTTLVFVGSSFTFVEDNGMTQLLGSGKFAVKKDSLFLTYHEVAANDSSRYTIEFADEKYPATTAAVTVNVFEKATKKPFGHAYVTAKNDTGSPVITTIADATGQGNFILYPNQHISILDIGAVGYYSATIPFVKLLGKAATINVYLEPASKIYVPAKTDAYRILSYNGKRLVLQLGDEKIVFLKQ